MESTNQFAGTSTTSPPGNTGSYTLVYNIVSELWRLMSYPSTLCFVCATVVRW